MNGPRELGAVLRAVTKTFGSIEALQNVELEANPGEILALTGPSGAGKTTACRIISGLEEPDSGEVIIGGRSMRGVGPQKRRVAFMFESYALYPHMTVRENLYFPLRSPNLRNRYTESKLKARVDELLNLTEMSTLQGRRPSELSGGQKQRVALCRALAQDPSVYLLDEPIAHLDAKLRHKLRGEIRQRLVSGDVPTLWCTPDAMEAIAVGDRVAVLAEGKVQQIGPPAELYHSPGNVTVASLIGDPPINLLSGRLSQSDGELLFEHPGIRVSLPENAAARTLASSRSEAVILGIRPTGIDLKADRSGSLRAEVYTVEPFGKHSIVTMTVGDDRLKAKTFDSVPFRTGEQVSLAIRQEQVTLFDGDTGLAIH